MTVAELIALLQTKPQDMLVAYALHSEYCLLEVDQITIQRHCEPRPDGWVHEKRPDKPTREYLMFPGN